MEDLTISLGVGPPALRLSATAVFYTPVRGSRQDNSPVWVWIRPSLRPACWLGRYAPPLPSTLPQYPLGA